MSDKLNKIMLVEDEPNIATVAKFTLERRGKFTVKYCMSGEEALREIASFQPDLILLDVMMPGMDGLETLGEIRKNKSFDHIPVVFLTAKTQSSEIQQYKALGITDVITKPFSATTLNDTILNIWENFHAKEKVE